VEAAEFSNLPCPSQNPGEQPPSADALLEAGNTFYSAGDLRQAEKIWLETRGCAGASPSWPKAVFNLGILEMQLVNYPKAIGFFNEVLESHPNDREPGGNIMQVYRNYSNRSALQISMSYEKMADYRHALDYAWLAKTRYPYQSWCGTCLQSANSAILKRIARLSLHVYGVRALAVVALAGIFLVWKKPQIA
jgi:tetratricopeptide (TPR) repeat protein